MRNRRRRHTRRHSYNRNPRLMGFTLPPLQPVLYAAGGFVGVPALESIVNPMLPLSITSTTLGKYAVRVAGVIGLTWLSAKVFGREQAKYVGIGGGAYVLTSAIREFAPGVIPGLSGVGAYVPAGRGMGAYVPSSGPAYRALGAAPATVTAKPVMSRFQRF